MLYERVEMAIDTEKHVVSGLTLKALNYFLKTLETKGFFQFEIIVNVSVSCF